MKIFSQRKTPYSRETQRAVLSSPAGWIATGFGAGFSPFASGTVGSLVALLPYLFLRELPLGIYLAVIVIAFALGVWVSEFVVRKIQIEDPGIIVWDEFVGQWIALTFAPHNWRWVLAGFLLFRLFDIWKPWPVSWADRSLKGGWGVMADDALAGVYAGLCLGLLQLIFA